MNEQDSTLLNNYFNGLLSETERVEAKQRATQDPEFGAEFHLRQEMEGFPLKLQQREDLKNTFQSIGDQFFSQVEETGTAPAMKARITRSRWLTSLAAALTLAIAAVWFLNQDNTSLYQQYSQHAPLSLTLRGNAENRATDAEKSFNTKDYAAALTALQDVLKEHPDSSTALLYKGICLVELLKPKDARDVLIPLSLQNNALKSDALWYIALSYVSEKNNKMALSFLEQIPKDDIHYAQAVKLIGKLK